MRWELSVPEGVVSDTHAVDRRTPGRPGEPRVVDAVPFSLDLEISREGECSFLSRRHFRWPYEIGILTHGHHKDLDPATASLVVQSATSGLIAGERLRQRVVVRDGGRVRVVGQGAMPVQRAKPGRGSAEDLVLEVDAGSHLEFVAEPRLLFPESAFDQVTRVGVEPGSEAVLVDAVVRHPDPGPVSYCSEIRLEYAGELAAVERMGFEAADHHRSAATALILAVGERFGDCAWAEWLSRHGAPSNYGAVSPLRGSPGVSVRVVADDGRLLREAVDEALAVLR